MERKIDKRVLGVIQIVASIIINVGVNITIAKAFAKIGEKYSK